PPVGLDWVSSAVKVCTVSLFTGSVTVLVMVVAVAFPQAYCHTETCPRLSFNVRLATARLRCVRSVPVRLGYPVVVQVWLIEPRVGRETAGWSALSCWLIFRLLMCVCYYQTYY